MIAPLPTRPHYYARPKGGGGVRSLGLDTFVPTKSGQWSPISAQKLLRFSAPKARAAEDYNAQFQRTSGWTGADGSYSVPMPDGSTVWLFSDTFVGDVLPDGRRAPGTKFVNNTIAHQKAPGQVDFFHAGSAEKPQAVFTPPDGKGWFWVHDAQADKDGKLSVLLGQFDKTDQGGALAFEAVGGWLAQMEVTPEGPKVSGYQKLPHFQKGDRAKGQPSVFYGSSVLKDGPYLYVYGVKDYDFSKESVVSRVKSQDLSNPEKWEFFNGQEWSSDNQEAKPVADNVSVEYSVHATAHGDYVMVAQGGGLSADVQVRRAPRPEGPWSEPETVWTAPEQKGSDLAYNAKAHPELSDERGLLVSYNLNSLDWNRNLQVADVYRPRFIRISDPSLKPRDP